MHVRGRRLLIRHVNAKCVAPARVNSNAQHGTDNKAHGESIARALFASSLF